MSFIFTYCWHKMRLVFSVMIVMFVLTLCPLSNADANEIDLQASDYSEANDNEVVDSGTWGTCAWEYTQNGTVTIYPGSDWFEVRLAQADYFDYRMVYKTTFTDLQRQIKRIVFKEVDGEKVIAPIDCSCLFKGLYSLESVDFSGLDTSNTTNIGGLFRIEVYPQTLDTSMNEAKSVITDVNMSCLDLSNVTYAAQMFANCWKLKRLDMSGVNIPKASSLAGMFFYCEELQQVEMANCDLSSVKDVSNMFRGCRDLKSVSLPSFDAVEPVDMNSMFWNCGKLTDLDVSKWQSQKVSDTGSMFYECSSLKGFDCNAVDVSSDRDMSRMFYGCDKISELDTSNWHANCSTYTDMFYRCLSLKELDLTYFKTDSSSSGGYYRSGDYGGLNAPSFDLCNSLECIITGPGVGYLGSIKGVEDSNHTDWFSWADGRWESPNEKYGVADKYTKYVPVQYLSSYSESVDPYTGLKKTPKMYFFVKGNWKFGRPMPWGEIVYTDDTTLLSEGVDYTISYGDNVNSGIGTATITGLGGYRGAKTFTFNIPKAANLVKASKTSVTKKLKAKALKKRAITISLPSVSTNYGDAVWSVVKRDKKKKLTLSGNKVLVKKKTKVGTYTIKLQANVPESQNYTSAKTNVVKVKVSVKKK